MTSKELVLRAISFQEVPRVPTAVLDGYLWLLNRHQMSQQDLLDMEDDKAAELVVKYYETVGSDMIFAAATCGSALQEVLGGACDYSAVAAPVTVKRRAIQSLEQVRDYDPAQVWEKLQRHPILLSHRRRLQRIHELAGEEKLIMAFSLGPLTMAASLVGMENLLVALYEEPELVDEVLDFGQAMSHFLIDDQVAHGATGISLAEPLSSVNLISEDTFQTVSLPRVKRTVEAMKHHGLPVMLHICGDSASRLEPLRESGVDIFSLDGGDLKHILEISRGHYAVFGNLDTVQVMLDDTPESVARQAGELCAIAGLGGGFILAPGCDLPPATPLENILAMTGAARK